MEKTRKKFRLRISPRKYNDLLLIAILTVLLLSMELALFFYNGIFVFNLLGIINDTAIYFGIFMLLNLIRSVRTKKILFGFVFVFFTLLFVIDAFYSRLFNNFSSVSSLTSAKNIFKQDLKLIGFAPPALFMAICAALGIFLICIIKLPAVRRKSFFKVAVSMIMSVAIAVTGANIAAVALIKSKRFENNYDYYSSNKYLYEKFYSGKKYASIFGYLNFRLKDLVMSSHSVAITVEELSLLFDERENKTENLVTGCLQGQNIITIMGETLDTRIIDPVLTPNLYQFMSDSFVFDNYYVPTFFEGATINSEFMSQIGMLPVTASWTSNFGNKYHMNYFGDYSLAAQMGKNGYETYYFHNYEHDFYCRDTMIPNWGFKNIRFGEDLAELGYPEYIKDTSLLGFFDGDTIDYDSKFYIHMTTYSMHAGYDDRYAENLSFVKSHFSGILEKTAVYYAKAIEFDAFIGGLIAKLDERGVLDNTTVIIYPDHYNYQVTETYKDIGVNPESKEIHHQKLMMRVGESCEELENILGGKEISLTGSTLDIAPTVLNLTAQDAVYKYFMGKDIFDGEGIVFFEDLTVSNGRTFLDIDQRLTGDEADRDQLRIALEEKILFRDLSPLIYDLDYFFWIKHPPEEFK